MIPKVDEIWTNEDGPVVVIGAASFGKITYQRGLDVFSMSIGDFVRAFKATHRPGLN